MPSEVYVEKTPLHARTLTLERTPEDSGGLCDPELQTGTDSAETGRLCVTLQRWQLGFSWAPHKRLLVETVESLQRDGDLLLDPGVHGEVSEKCERRNHF